MSRLRAWPRWKRIAALGGLGAATLFVLIQAVPYGWSHSNPSVVAEPRWNSAATRALAAASCFDCHSNLTRWRWYSYVAPVSWLVQRDVAGGRGALNFSEWNRPQDGVGDVVDAIRSGSMPPWYYTLLHSNAGLNASEKSALISGLEATFANSPPPPGGGG
jgi:mono/diheme cytochrome c family protein